MNIDNIEQLEAICKQAARVFAGKDWHEMTTHERELCDMLKWEGYFEEYDTRHIGRAIHG